jgi:Fe-S cluster biogenesis protein NfuA
MGPGAAHEEDPRMENAAVETALDNVRPALDADGFDLKLGSVGSDGAVEIVLEARADACLECLVPDQMLVKIIETAIREQDPGVGQVTLTKSGFEAIAADH